MSENDKPKYRNLYFGILRADFAEARGQWLRRVWESAVPGIAVLPFLAKFGSDDAPMDAFIERVVLLAGAAVVVPVVRAGWAIVTAPRRIYYEQQARIAAAEQKCTMFSAQLAEKLSRSERLSELAVVYDEGSELMGRRIQNSAEAAQWHTDLKHFKSGALRPLLDRLPVHQAVIVAGGPIEGRRFAGRYDDAHNKELCSLHATLDRLKALITKIESASD